MPNYQQNRFITGIFSYITAIAITEKSMIFPYIYIVYVYITKIFCYKRVIFSIVNY